VTVATVTPQSVASLKNVDMIASSIDERRIEKRR